MHLEIFHFKKNKKNMNNRLDFNKELLHLYLQSEMSQLEFAENTRQSASSINHWLNNHQRMSYDKFVDVCDNLNIKLTIKIE